MVGMLTSQLKAEECQICLENYMVGDKVSQLACFSTHRYHSECIDDFIKKEKEKGGKPLCPICRREIDESKIKRSILEADATTKDEKTDDVFALGKDKAQDDNVQMSAVPNLLAPSAGAPGSAPANIPGLP